MYKPMKPVLHSWDLESNDFDGDIGFEIIKGGMCYVVGMVAVFITMVILGPVTGLVPAIVNIPPEVGIPWMFAIPGIITPIWFLYRWIKPMIQNIFIRRRHRKSVKEWEQQCASIDLDYNRGEAVKFATNLKRRKLR